MSGKKALITGITGQDGAYLSELLISKGYEVHGLKRRSSLFNTSRIDHLYKDLREEHVRFKLLYGDLSDFGNITRIIQEVQPDEIYNLGAMSHVMVSFEMPEHTADINGIATLRILEAIRVLGLAHKTKVYQASTSELFGLTSVVPQDEKTPFYPRSPYAIAKLYAHWTIVNYREAYGIFACNGILFNHESPLRGETFVTRKITRAAARIGLGSEEILYLGNLDARRDWGHAKDYVEAMYLMLQQQTAKDYVVATGISTSIRQFLKMAFGEMGIDLHFEGSGLNEIAVVLKCNNPRYTIPPGQIVVRIDPNHYRPTETGTLQGNSQRIRQELGWTPKHNLTSLINEMMIADIELAKNEMNIKQP